MNFQPQAVNLGRELSSNTIFSKGLRQEQPINNVQKPLVWLLKGLHVDFPLQQESPKKAYLYSRFFLLHELKKIPEIGSVSRRTLCWRTLEFKYFVRSRSVLNGYFMHDINKIVKSFHFCSFETGYRSVLKSSLFWILLLCGIHSVSTETLFL